MINPILRSMWTAATIRLVALVPVLCGTIGLAAEVLPVGSNPPPLEISHFPDRMHAFIWRNWNVVETGRLARVLGTSAENVRAVAAAMGLPPEQPLTSQQRSRLYLTIIRRNWHLLPYDQLLVLLDMSADQLAYTLREDDFLWVKLGYLKPRCEHLSYAAPTPETQRREAAIRALVEQEFGQELAKPAEPLFGFLNTLGGSIAQPVPPKADDAAGLRFLYSYFAIFGDPLWDPALDPYPDALLQKLSSAGVNGIWLHVVLRQLAPSAEFPEFGEGYQRRLENLRTLVRRAQRFGIRVYLYMNEPRAMPPAFFANRVDMAGVREGDHIAMCTSNPKVRQWLSDSLAYVFTHVPDLGGVFTITASENLTNCISHHNASTCPRCKDRTPAAIIAEVNAAIEAGVHRGNPNARVLAWDWGWQDSWAKDIIAHLPKSVWLMSVSEWSLPLSRGGVSASVGEYSISAVGPGPRARKHWALAKEAGLKCVAKMQVNNTWELSAVPYLPVLDLVAEHCANLAQSQIDGMMLSWSLGGYPSPNLEVVSLFNSKPIPSKEQVLDTIALKRFGPAGARHARAAWSLFSKAFREYPFDGGVVYQVPVQLGPANLLYAKPTGYAATMVGFPYDDVKRWCGPYPPEVLAGQFEKVAAGWKEALVELEQAAQQAPPHLAQEAQGDLRIAQAAHLHFQSVANQVRFTLARNTSANKDTSPDQRQKAMEQIRRLLQAEAANARALFSLARQDSRIGFEASNQYYYLPQDLIEKVLNCRHLLAQPELTR
ncbi:MAG: hypothetical protein ACM359_15135 [Bacillota bacterium]